MSLKILRGECNQCGLCCIESDGSRCIYLNNNPLGSPGNPMATYCSAYATRYDGMPIVMVKDSLAVRVAWCAKDSPAETKEIIARGIGKGCSLKLME